VGYDPVSGVLTKPLGVEVTSPSAVLSAPPAGPTVPAPFEFAGSFQVPVKGFGYGLETDGSSLYWYGPYVILGPPVNQKIHVLDPTDGTVLNTLTVPMNSQVGLALAFDGTNLFYSDANFGYQGDIYEVTTSGTPIGSFSAPGKTVTAMTFFGGELYAWDSGWGTTWKMYVLDPVTGSTKREFEIGVNFSFRTRGMAAHGDRIIAYNGLDGVFVEIDPSTGELGKAYTLPLSPLSPQFQSVTGMASDGTNLYVLEIDYWQNSYISTYVPRRSPPVGQCPPGFDEVLSDDPLFDPSVDRNNNGRICSKGAAMTDDNAR
jgi:hypothetical protein